MWQGTALIIKIKKKSLNCSLIKRRNHTPGTIGKHAYGFPRVGRTVISQRTRVSFNSQWKAGRPIIINYNRGTFSWLFSGRIVDTSIICFYFYPEISRLSLQWLRIRRRRRRRRMCSGPFRASKKKKKYKYIMFAFRFASDFPKVFFSYIYTYAFTYGMQQVFPCSQTMPLFNRIIRFIEKWNNITLCMKFYKGRKKNIRVIFYCIVGSVYFVSGKSWTHASGNIINLHKNVLRPVTYWNIKLKNAFGLTA